MENMDEKEGMRGNGQKMPKIQKGFHTREKGMYNSKNREALKNETSIH